MNYLLTGKMLRRDKKVINHPISTADLDFVEFYEEFSRDWKERARALRERRLAALRSLYG